MYLFDISFKYSIPDEKPFRVLNISPIEVKGEVAAIIEYLDVLSLKSLPDFILFILMQWHHSNMFYIGDGYAVIRGPYSHPDEELRVPPDYFCVMAYEDLTAWVEVNKFYQILIDYIKLISEIDHDYIKDLWNSPLWGGRINCLLNILQSSIDKRHIQSIQKLGLKYPQDIEIQYSDDTAVFNVEYIDKSGIRFDDIVVDYINTINNDTFPDILTGSLIMFKECKMFVLLDLAYGKGWVPFETANINIETKCFFLKGRHLNKWQYSVEIFYLDWLKIMRILSERYLQLYSDQQGLNHRIRVQSLIPLIDTQISILINNSL